MVAVKVDLNLRENAKIGRLMALYGVKSKEKAIKKAIMQIRESEDE